MQDRQGRPGADRGQPARRLRLVRRPGGARVEAWCEQVNAPGRTGRPAQRRSSGCWSSGLDLHVLPGRAAYRSRWARNGWSTTTRPSGSGRCATPPRPGTSGRRVWCRVVGDELVIVARTGCRARRDRPAPAVHARQPQDRRRALPAPPRRRAVPRPPKPRPRTEAEDRLPRLGEGAQPVAGRGRRHRRARVRSKMARRVELAARSGRRAGR